MCTSVRGYRENLGEPAPLPHGGQEGPVQLCPVTSTLPTAIHGSPGTGPQVPLPDLQGPVHPAPPPCCLSGPVPCTTCPYLMGLHWFLYTPGSYPSRAPFFGLPCCCVQVPEPLLHGGPVLSTSITSSVTSSLGEEQCQLLQTDGETEASNCPRSLHKLRVQRLEPTTAQLRSPHLNPALSTSPPGPPPPQTTTPWISAASTYCLQHFIPSCQAPSSQHMRLPHRWASFRRRTWVSPRLPWGRSTNGAPGRKRGQRENLCQGWSPYPPSPGIQGPPGPAETWSPRSRALRVPAAKKEVVNVGLLAVICSCLWAERWAGPSRHLLAPRPPPAHPREGPALQMPPAPAPTAPQGPGEGDGRKHGVRLV